MKKKSTKSGIVQKVMKCQGMTSVTVRLTQERAPNVMLQFHKTFQGMNTNSQRYHMSTNPQRLRPNHLLDYINHLPFKLFCAATVKHWANLEINLKVQQSTEIPYVNHPSDQTISFMGLYQPLTIQAILRGYC